MPSWYGIVSWDDESLAPGNMQDGRKSTNLYPENGRLAEVAGWTPIAEISKVEASRIANPTSEDPEQALAVQRWQEKRRDRINLAVHGVHAGLLAWDAWADPKMVQIRATIARRRSERRAAGHTKVAPGATRQDLESKVNRTELDAEEAGRILYEAITARAASAQHQAIGLHLLALSDSLFDIVKTARITDREGGTFDDEVVTSIVNRMRQLPAERCAGLLASGLATALIPNPLVLALVGFIERGVAASY